jgi:hypothetical protein
MTITGVKERAGRNERLEVVDDALAEPHRSIPFGLRQRVFDRHFALRRERAKHLDFADRKIKQPDLLLAVHEPEKLPLILLLLRLHDRADLKIRPVFATRQAAMPHMIDKNLSDFRRSLGPPHPA